MTPFLLSSSVISSVQSCKARLNIGVFTLLLSAGVVLSPQAVKAEDDLMLVLDASGSMWGQIAGKSKIEIARETVGSLLDSWPDNRNVGVVAYGHRKKGDCSDIETVQSVSKLNRGALKKVLNSLNPMGKTPLSAAVVHAAEELKFTENKATVVLLTDGLETCDMDPCKLGEELAKKGVDFTAHVIGFDVGSLDQGSLKCLAEKTGGKYLTANNAGELTKALENIVEATPVPTKAPVPEGKVLAPETAIKGTEVAIKVEGPSGLRGQLELYLVGAKKSVTYAYVHEDEAQGGYKPVTLMMPVNLGKYEVRWEKSGDVYGKANIEVVDSNISLLMPESAPIGTAVEVGFDAPAGMKGQIDLYAEGLNKSITYSYVHVDPTGAYKKSSIRMPGKTGKYEVRWSYKGDVYARKGIEVLPSEVSLVAPDKAPVGSAIEVGFNAHPGLKGQIDLYAAGLDKSITYSYVNEEASGGYKKSSIRVPVKPGKYEIRWNQKGHVYARKEIEVVDAEVSLNIPETALIGTKVKVDFNAHAGLKGQVALFAVGLDKSITYSYVNEEATGGYKTSTLRVPAKPGKYEVRWLQGSDVLAKKELEVVAADIGISLPAQAQAETQIDITLNAHNGLGGQVHLTLPGSDKQITYAYVRQDPTGGYQVIKIKLPAKLGTYEVKWVEQGDVYAKGTIEVVAASTADTQ